MCKQITPSCVTNFKKKMDIKCLTKAPGHILSPEHLQCTLAFCRNKRCSSKTHFLIWCFDDGGGDRCNTMVHMLKDFRIAKASDYDSHRFCAVGLSKSVKPPTNAHSHNQTPHTFVLY